MREDLHRSGVIRTDQESRVITLLRDSNMSMDGIARRLGVKIQTLKEFNQKGSYRQIAQGRRVEI